MKNAIVTGSTRGVGRAIAEELARKGYRVWISARSREELERAKHEIEQHADGEVQTERIDFTDIDQVKAYAEKVSTACDSVDVLVNNAGIFIPDRLTDGEEAFEKQMGVNFYAPYHLTQCLLPRFVKQAHGHIFNICSVVNRKPRAEAASYTISKFALWGYHQLLHQSLLPHGVKVTAFFPSSINTSSWEGIDAPREEFVQPGDIAAMIGTILDMQRGTVPSEIDLVSINPGF